MANPQLSIGTAYKVLLDGVPATGSVAWTGPGSEVDIEPDPTGAFWVARPLAEATGAVITAAQGGRTGSVTVDIVAAPLAITFEPL